MARYDAPKPQTVPLKGMEKALSYFPPFWLWNFLKFLGNKLAGSFVGDQILPTGVNFSSHFIDKKKIENLNQQQNKDNKLSYQKYTIKTHDDAFLDTLEIRHSSQNALHKKHQSYLINFVGSSECYEERLKKMQKEALGLKANVIGFNYRGIAGSTGSPSSTEDLVTDGIAQVQRLLAEGVSPQNITLKGHALGGAVATLVAHHFHSLNQPINLFSDRSFSSVSDEIIGDIRLSNNDKAGHNESFFGILLGWIATPFVKLALALTQWEMNAGEAYKAIPKEYKEYILVRTDKKGRVYENYIKGKCYTKDDCQVPHYASLHHFLKDERTERKEQIKFTMEQYSIYQNGGDKLKAEKEKFKERKMQTDYCNEEGHHKPMQKIANHKKQTAFDFFRNFVLEAHDHHGIVDESNSCEI